MAKIFISHSTKTNDAEKYLAALEKEFSRASIKKLLDREFIDLGDDWRKQIFHMIDEAHGAVMLLTPEAMRSNFVKIEASCFVWQKFRQPEFILIPVLLGGVSEAELEAGLYGELAMSSIQALKVGAGTPEEVAKEVVKSLRRKLKSIVCEMRTPRQRLEALVLKSLEKGGCTGQDLYEVGQFCLGWPQKSGSDTKLVEKFARDLMKADMLRACEAVKLLSVRGMEGARDLLALVAPCWVAEEDAKDVTAHALDEASKRALALNGEYTWTGKSYISRSSCMPLREGPRQEGARVVALEPPETGTLYPEQVKNQIIRELMPDNRSAREAGVGPLLRQINKFPQEGTPVFVIIPPELVPRRETFEQLKKDFSAVTFFILTKEDASKLQPLQDLVEPLRNIDRRREEECFDKYQMTWTSLS